MTTSCILNVVFVCWLSKPIVIWRLRHTFHCNPFFSYDFLLGVIFLFTLQMIKHSEQSRAMCHFCQHTLTKKNTICNYVGKKVQHSDKSEWMFYHCQTDLVYYYYFHAHSFYIFQWNIHDKWKIALEKIDFSQWQQHDQCEHKHMHFDGEIASVRSKFPWFLSANELVIRWTYSGLFNVLQFPFALIDACFQRTQNTKHFLFQMELKTKLYGKYLNGSINWVAQYRNQVISSLIFDVEINFISINFNARQMVIDRNAWHAMWIWPLFWFAWVCMWISRCGLKEHDYQINIDRSLQFISWLSKTHIFDVCYRVILYNKCPFYRWTK